MLCLRIPHFVATLTQRDNRALQEPFVIIDAGQARVVATSPQATEAGLTSVMTVRQAQTICPQALFLPAEPGYYRAVEHYLRDILTAFADRVELGHVDQALAGWLDAPADLAGQVGRTVREEVGLNPALGLAKGKFPAWVAALSARPGCMFPVASGQEGAFLANLPITLLPLEADFAQRLFRLGLTTMGQLANLPRKDLVTQFGPAITLLHQLAQGHDARPLATTQPDEQARQTITFSDPINDRAILDHYFTIFSQSLATDLQHQGQLCREVWLYLTLAQGDIKANHLNLHRPTACADRLTLVLGELLSTLTITSAIESLTVILTNFVPAVGQQLSLFSLGPTQPDQLGQTLQTLNQRYQGSFYRIADVNAAARRIENRFQFLEIE